MHALSLVAVSGGHSSSRCAGLSLSRPLLSQSTGSRRAGSVVVAHGPSCSTTCGIFPDQGSNPCPLHWQADSQPLCHQGSPCLGFWWDRKLKLNLLDSCWDEHFSHHLDSQKALVNGGRCVRAGNKFLNHHVYFMGCLCSSLLFCADARISHLPNVLRRTTLNAFLSVPTVSFPFREHLPFQYLEHQQIWRGCRLHWTGNHY